jgi:hypothetical protein
MIDGFAPRWLEPHPHSSQHTLFLARGPIVYYAEDADDPWEDNHFKDVIVKAGEPVGEELGTWTLAEEVYVKLYIKCYIRYLEAWNRSLGWSLAGQAEGAALEDKRLSTYPLLYACE